MTRYHDWQVRLESFLQERAFTPFHWGSNDCAMFAADSVLAITGRDPAFDLRGYQGVRGALRVQRIHGGLEGIATGALGLPVLPSLAAVGDVVLVQIGKRAALGVCAGRTAVGPSAAGLVHVSMSKALMAWRVG